MRIHLYSCLWNEIRLLPFFFRHYDPFVEKYVFFDDGSTDGTLEYLAERPHVEVQPIVRTGDSIIDIGRKIKSECWKESRGKADLVIVCDVDEFLWHEDLRGAFCRGRKYGMTAHKPTGWNMVAETFPETDGQIYEVVTRGMRDSQYDKLVCFKPDTFQEMIYSPGCHNVKPIGQMLAWPDLGFKLLHFKALGPDYLRERYAELNQKLMGDDRRRRLGWQYAYPEQDVERFFGPGVITEQVL